MKYIHTYMLCMHQRSVLGMWIKIQGIIHNRFEQTLTKCTKARSVYMRANNGFPVAFKRCLLRLRKGKCAYIQACIHTHLIQIVGGRKVMAERENQMFHLFD